MSVGKLIYEYVALPNNDPEHCKRKLEDELRELFSRRAPYTMLVRSYFGHRPEIRALFEESP